MAGVVEELSEAYTSQLLKQAPEVYHTQINDLLLAALALALKQWRGAEVGEAEGTVRVKVDLEGHGRQPGGRRGAGLDSDGGMVHGAVSGGAGSARGGDTGRTR